MMPVAPPATADGPPTADASTPDDAAVRTTAAVALGRRLAESVADPEELALYTDRGLRDLARPGDAAELRRVSPGIDSIVGVSFFVVGRIARSFRRATRRDSVSNLLHACDRWLGLPMLEARWLAVSVLEPLVVRDPERSWQLLRRVSREARDWITVDALAHPVGVGILAEPFRWAELGQLVFAPSPWERRLVGSTVATLPYIDHEAGREPQVAEQGLVLIGSLIGDDRPEVQKALAWALRSLVVVDAAAVLAFCRREAEKAATEHDGHRAWVVRDVLSKLPAAEAAAMRDLLSGVRKRPDAPSTSAAATVAAGFISAGGVPALGGPHVERIPLGAR